MSEEKKYKVELTQTELLEIQQFAYNKKTYEKRILENRLDFNAKFKDDGVAWSPEMIKDSEDQVKFFENLYNKLNNATSDSLLWLADYYTSKELFEAANYKKMVELKQK